MNISIKKCASLAVFSLALGAFVFSISPVFAQTPTQDQQGNNWHGGLKMNRMPAVVGTVSAINGTTLTVIGKAKFNGGSTNTYTVNASNATVMKNGQASSVSSIVVGDKAVIRGSINGTNVVAKTIRIGNWNKMTVQAQGNGQPVIAGTITSMNGNTATVTNKSNVVYQVDLSGAKLMVRGVTSPSVSDINVGDNVIVQGAVSGTNVQASSLIDQKVKVSTGNENQGNQGKGKNEGFMSGIGNFFKHMFGF